MRLLVGIPTLDYMNAEFVKCLTALIQRLHDDGVDHEVYVLPGTLVYMAREQIALKAIHNDYTHVLWLDADMVFEPSILDNLLNNGKRFVTGIYHSRRGSYASNIYKMVIPGVKVERFEDYPDELFQIAGCGFGCALTEVSLLREMRDKHKACFTPRKDLGEDMAFCLRTTEMGEQLWCDPHVVCGHIGHIAIYPDDHQRYKEARGRR